MSLSISFQQKLTQELVDPVDLPDLLNTAVTLVPCGHNINELTIAKVNNLCPICRDPFKESVKNTTIRNLVEIVEKMPLEVEKVDHTEEAKMLFEKAKGLFSINKISKAIDVLSQALDISPNYKEAIGYNACLLDMLKVQQASKRKEEVDSFRSMLEAYLKGLEGGPYGGSISYASKAIDRLTGVSEFNDKQKEVLKGLTKEFTNGSSNDRYKFLENFLIASRPPEEIGIVSMQGKLEKFLETNAEQIKYIPESITRLRTQESNEKQRKEVLGRFFKNIAKQSS